MKNELSVKKNILYNSSATILYWACQWLLSVIVVRLSGFYVGGEFALAQSFASIFIIVASFNSKPYQVSDLEPKYSDGNYIAFRLFTLVLALLFCVAIVFTFQYSMEQNLIIISFILYKSFEIYIDVYHGIFQKMWRFDFIFYSLALRGILSVVFFSFTLHVSGNLFLSILVMSVVTLCTAFLIDFNFAHRKNKVKIQITYEKAKGLLIECVPLLSNSIMITISALMPRFLLESYYGSKVLGIYSSIAMPAMIIQLCAGFILSPLTTLFSELYIENKINDFKKLFLKSAVIIMGLTFVALIGVHFFGDFGLKLLYGSEIVKYRDLLPTLTIISSLTAVLYFVTSINIVFRNNKSLLLSSAIGLIIVSVFSTFIIKKESMTGANEITVVALVVQILVLVIPIVAYILKGNQPGKVMGNE